VVIVEGLIEITNTTADGEDRIIGLFGPGEIIGLSAILKRMSFPANAVVSSKNARVIKLFIRSLEPGLSEEQKHEFQNWLKEMLLIHEQILRDKIMILGAGRLHSKLLELFEHLNSRFGKKATGKDLLIPVPITKTQIAKMIEARVETVIRTLNKWEKRGFFLSDDKGLLIKDIEKLKSMAEVL
jgi:CRP-like cAMP-binding protein